MPDKFDQVDKPKAIRPERKTAKTDFNSLAIESHYHPLTQIVDEGACQSHSILEKNTKKTVKNYKTHRAEPKSQRIIKLEEGYKEGLKKYDIKTEEVYKKIQAQNQEYH